VLTSVQMVLMHHVPTKQLASKGDGVQTKSSWLIMSWASAQAGNRASRTDHQLQWWENIAEPNAQ
jgi:hypothetical protein